MKRLQANGNSRRTRHAGQSGSVRIIVLSLACFLAGIVLTFCLLRNTSRAPVNSAGAPPLSDATKAVLRRLDSPVEIRFYSLLDPQANDPAMEAFSIHVDQLIALYQQAGGDKIQLIKAYAPTYTDSAVADGIKPFNLDKGNGCFLGIAIIGNGQKESLPHLAPEWESALESDLTRVIARVAAPAPPARPAPRADIASLEAVRRALTSLKTISLEEGTENLRAAALAEFQKAALNMQAELNKAQQDFLQAQNNQSEAQQQAALKRIKEIQAEQTAKLKQIAANSRAQIVALQQIKKEAQ